MPAQDILADFKRRSEQAHPIPNPKEQKPEQMPVGTDPVKTGAGAILSDFRQRSQRQPVEVKIAEEPGFFAKAADVFTGGLRQTPETETLEEVQKAPEFEQYDWPTLKASIGLLASGDESATKDILQKNLGAEFRRDSKNNLVVKLPSGEYMANAPGTSEIDFMRGIAQTAAFLHPSKFLGALKGFGAKLVGSAALGAGSETALQSVEQLTGSEQGYRKGDIALAGTVGPLAEVVAPEAVKQFRGRGRLPGAALETPKQTEEVTRRLEQARVGQQETGIELLEPQATGIPSQLVAMRALGEIAPTSEKVARRLKKQNEQAHTAVEEFLNIIAPPESVGRGARAVRGAAEEAIDKAKQARTEAASPIYKQAFQESGPISVQPVLDGITESLEELPKEGKIAKQLNKARRLLTEEITEVVDGEEVTKRVPIQSLQVLHGVHRELGDMIESAKLKGLGPTAKRSITQIDSQLTDLLKDQAPLYRDASEEFKRLSPAVKDLQEGVIGRLANVDDAQLKQISSIIFDPQESNPAVVRDAIKVIEDVNPDAVPAILRTHLEKVISKKPGLSDLDAIDENVPAKLQNALFRTKKDRDMFFAAASPQAKRRAVYLNNMLTKASTGRGGGSDTAKKIEFIKQMRDSAGTSLTEKIFNPRKTLVEWRKDVKFEKVANQLAEALIDGGDKWSESWDRVLSHPPNSPKAYAALAQMLARITEDQERE